jgi:hypothetical protein
MKVFAHHLYEYRKGLRRLILHTTSADYEALIVKKLELRGIAYIIQRVSARKINVFFGKQYCIDVLNSFPHLNLTSLPPDKDFILGAMLGYDMKIHCERYLRKVKAEKGTPEIKIMEAV